MVIIVFGLPGSGKSYFASRLATLLGAEYINSDRVRKQLFSIRTYSSEEKSAVYAEMLARAAEQLRQQRHVVLDATFHNDSSRREFIDALGTDEVFFIEVWADEAIVRNRVRQPRAWSEADFDVYTLIKRAWEPMREPHLCLQSTDDNIHEMLQQATAWLPKDND